MKASICRGRLLSKARSMRWLVKMIGFGERWSEGWLSISVHLFTIIHFNPKLFLYPVFDLWASSLESCLGWLCYWCLLTHFNRLIKPSRWSASFFLRHQTLIQTGPAFVLIRSKRRVFVTICIFCLCSSLPRGFWSRKALLQLGLWVLWLASG